VGNWYRVTKRINDRLYDYWQRTKRVGKSVKTEKQENWQFQTGDFRAISDWR
jgi:hypothetical protein